MNDVLHTPLVPKTALILGLGQTGMASARWLARQGVALRLMDTRSPSASVTALLQELGAAVVESHFGEHAPQDHWFDGLDMVVVSPGLIPGEQPTSQWIAQAQAGGAQVLGEIELFAQALQMLAAQRQYHPRVLGITGTNGKTTVTALTRLMCESAGLQAVAAGNISPAALDALMAALDQDQWPDVWVLELSSFQLMTTHSLKMAGAVVLNITQDHLDWHGSLKAYADAKARIFAMADVQIVNRDDPAVMALVPSLDKLTVRSFGAEVPVFMQDLGLEQHQGMVWLASAEPTDFDDQPKVRRKKNDPEPVRQAGRQARLMPADALPMVGQHNVMNVLAAAALARSLGIAWTPILKAAADYHGEPHRMRFVRTIREVDFYNDSKGTNVGATVAGISGLGRSLVLIAGGVGKGQDFDDLAKALAAARGQAVLIGVDADRLKLAFDRYGVSTRMAESMQHAVQVAFEMAEPGQAVVLSPACASFDMFKGYDHRGEVFVAEVTELALSLGEVA